MNKSDTTDILSILLVSGQQKAAAAIKALLDTSKFRVTEYVQSGANARRLILERDYDLILINSPLPDEKGTDFACHAAESTSAGIVLLVDNGSFDDVCMKCEPYGIMTISKPFTKAVFEQVLALVSATKRRLFILEKENSKLSRRMEEMKTVSEAKYILIEKKNMTEDEAHKYIEKMSMNQRVTKTEMAKSIIRMYK